MGQLRVGHSVYRIEGQRLENPLFLWRNAVLISTAGHRLGWDVCAEGFFGHVVAGCGVGPGSAAAADLPVPAEAALAFKTFAVAHPRQILALMPDIGKPAGAWAGKPRFEDAAAVYGQIPAGKHISLMAHEQHSQTSQTSLRRTVRASAPHQSSGGR